MDLVKILSERYMKPELPEMNVGDTVPSPPITAASEK